MKLLIISDLHIGENQDFNTFQWNSSDFIKMLRLIILEHKIDKIILNGDIYDLYQTTFDKIQVVNTEIIDYFNMPEFVYIKGNHDISMRFGLNSFTIRNSSNKLVHIEHGHKADFTSGTRLGRIISKYFIQLLIRIVKVRTGKALFNRIHNYYEEIEHVPRKYNSIKYLTYALRLLRKYDMVIFGHTHKLEVHKTFFILQKKVYINSGTCSLGRFQGIVLNTENLKYKLLKFSKKAVVKYLKKNDLMVSPHTA